MKPTLLILALLPLLLLLTGCPYNSKIPLSEPKVAIDKTLLGEWKNDKAPNDSSLIKIFEFNPYEYSIVVVDKSDHKTTVDYYRAFITSVAGQKLLNLESLKSKGEFNFCSYAVEENLLTVKVVSDIAVKEKYISSKTLVNAFAQKIHDKDFFESGLVFRKIK